MHYMFDMAIATAYDLDTAVFLQNIAFWIGLSHQRLAAFERRARGVLIQGALSSPALIRCT